MTSFVHFDSSIISSFFLLSVEQVYHVCLSLEHAFQNFYIAKFSIFFKIPKCLEHDTKTNLVCKWFSSLSTTSSVDAQWLVTVSQDVQLLIYIMDSSHCHVPSRVEWTLLLFLSMRFKGRQTGLTHPQGQLSQCSLGLSKIAKRLTRVTAEGSID